MADATYQPKVYNKLGGDELVVASGGAITVESGGAINAPTAVQSTRIRSTVAEVNAGKTLLAAVAGKSYRLVSCYAIAYGGAATAVTTVDILGTQSTSSVKLVAYAQASLTQSTVLKDGGTGAAVLADGASYAPCDANTAITIGKTGSSVATATGIDVVINYTIE